MTTLARRSCSVSALPDSKWCVETTQDGRNYSDTIFVNTRNASNIEIVEHAPPLTKEEIKNEFSAGDISKQEQDMVMDNLDVQIERRRRYLEAKAKRLNLPQEATSTSAK
jgi:hypothetical protein